MIINYKGYDFDLGKETYFNGMEDMIKIKMLIDLNLSEMYISKIDFSLDVLEHLLDKCIENYEKQNPYLKSFDHHFDKMIEYLKTKDSFYLNPNKCFVDFPDEKTTIDISLEDVRKFLLDSKLITDEMTITPYNMLTIKVHKD